MDGARKGVGFKSCLDMVRLQSVGRCCEHGGSLDQYRRVGIVCCRNQEATSKHFTGPPLVGPRRARGSTRFCPCCISPRRQLVVASEGMVEGWTEGVALKRAKGFGTWIGRRRRRARCWFCLRMDGPWDAQKCGGTCLAGRGGEPGNNIGAVGVRFQHS